MGNKSSYPQLIGQFFPQTFVCSQAFIIHVTWQQLSRSIYRLNIITKILLDILENFKNTFPHNIKIKWCTYLSKPMLKHHSSAKSATVWKKNKKQKKTQKTAGHVLYQFVTWAIRVSWRRRTHTSLPVWKYVCSQAFIIHVTWQQLSRSIYRLNIIIKILPDILENFKNTFSLGCTYLSKPMLKHHSPAKSGHSINILKKKHKKLRDMCFISLWHEPYWYITPFFQLVPSHIKLNAWALKYCWFPAFFMCKTRFHVHKIPTLRFL
jgi:orotate phosphoribosyltransferase-like protein